MLQNNEETRSMRIEVLAEGTISAQARTYAEYRLFAALTQLVDTSRVTRARLVLKRTTPGRTRDSVSCTVAVDIEGGDSLRIQVAADHPYAAINRAVERLSDGRWRRKAEDGSPVTHATAE
jgi:ribosome-associated translation inhibitor RaiA